MYVSDPDAWFIFNLHRESNFFIKHTQIYVIMKRGYTFEYERKKKPMIMNANPHLSCSLD
jgi:hypothetical protein